MSAGPGPARMPLGRGTPSPVAQDMTVMIHRLLAGYAVLGLLPSLPGYVDQAPSFPWPWAAAVLLVGSVVVTAMVVRAFRGLALGRLLPAFCVYTLLAVWSMSLFGVDGEYPFLWFHVGLAVVCACVWGGVGLGAAYGVVLGLGWTLLRLAPAGGGVRLGLATSEGVFGASAGLVVGVVALGMMTSARTADQLADQLREQGVRQAVDRAVADERARLDQLIHDDVMTTLSAAAHSQDAATGQATSRLARETLATIDALRDAAGAGALAVSVLVSLAEQTVRRVSPVVRWQAEVRPGAAALPVPGPQAQTLLSALRESVRNAVRHSGADTIDARLEARRDADVLVLRAAVVDDGRGFDTERLPVDRLGVRVSMLEASHQVGLTTRLVSRPGHGTRFSLSWSGRPRAVARLTAEPEEGEPRLPADFPARRFSAVAWFSLLVDLGIALVTASSYTRPAALAVAVLLVVLATGLVLRPGAGLQLPALDAGLAVLALAAAHGAMLLTLPRPALGMFLWHEFPLQLVLVVLVVRRRAGWAVVGLVVTEAVVAWFSLTGPDGWPGVLSWGSGPLLFVAMAVLVNRVLLAIQRRQTALRREEDAALEASVRQHVSRVQRSLWVADLRTQARSILLRLADVEGPVPTDLRDEALLLEATLRESLVARNVMSDELADLTEAARRRGVEVRLVDSRHTVVPRPIAQAVLDVVRRALAVPDVRRLVVRLAPEDGSVSASVLSEDDRGTHLVRLDASGTPVAQELSRG